MNARIHCVIRFSFFGPESRLCPAGLLLDRWHGRIKSDSMSDPSRTTMITIGMLRIIFPIIPVAIRSGAKATMVVRTEKITGRPTSVVP